jgi:hypothetical protein
MWTRAFRKLKKQKRRGDMNLDVGNVSMLLGSNTNLDT